MTDDKPWVVVWGVPKQSLEIPCWLMVKHRTRGWELPGGTIGEDEPNEIAALRELFEETGLKKPIDSFHHIHTLNCKKLEYNFHSISCIMMNEVQRSKIILKILNKIL